MTMTPQFVDMKSSLDLFGVAVFLLSSLVTDPSFISISILTIFGYEGLTRNSEIGNTPDPVFPSMWRLRKVRNAKFGMNVSNEMLLNAAKFQGYSCYYFWVIKGKPKE